MNIVKDSPIYLKGEDNEKANKVISADEANVGNVASSWAVLATNKEAQADDGRKDDGADLPTLTQLS